MWLIHTKLSEVKENILSDCKYISAIRVITDVTIDMIKKLAIEDMYNNVIYNTGLIQHICFYRNAKEVTKVNGVLEPAAMLYIVMGKLKCIG